MKEYEDIHIQTFSSASDEARYLIGCRGQYYEAGVVVANLITTLKEYGTEDEAIKAFLRNNNNRYYDLKGNKLTSPKRGINVINGKKIVVE